MDKEGSFIHTGDGAQSSAMWPMHGENVRLSEKSHSQARCCGFSRCRERAGQASPQGHRQTSRGVGAAGWGQAAAAYGVRAFPAGSPAALGLDGGGVAKQPDVLDASEL